MVELGEAQCFYVITLAIAVIYSDSQGAIFNGAENFPSIIKNQSVTLFVVYMASLPMITVQLSLRYVSMDSVYTLFFTTLATALAGVAVTLKEKDISTDQARRMFMQDRALEECGGNPSLRALCDRTDATSLRISRPSSDIWTALGVLACLWCLKLLQGRFSKIERLCSGALTTNGKSERSASAKALLFIRVLVWLCPQLCSAVLLAAHLFFVCLTFVNLARISGEMKSSYDDGYLPWNLGQVVAMLVWVPMLAKYTYAILCKFHFFRIAVTPY